MIHSSVMEQLPYVVGLSGGIGSGKSTVAKIFESIGIPVYYSDERAKQLYYVPEIKVKVKDFLGKKAYLSDGKINRKFISDVVFSDTDKLEKLNALLHPFVKEDFKIWLQEKNQYPYVIKESALLFETGLFVDCFKNIVVNCPTELRINRVINRDKVSRQEVLNRIKFQMPEEKKLEMGGIEFKNNEEVFLIDQVLRFHENMLNS